MEGLTLLSYVPLPVFQAYYNPPSKPRPNLLAYSIATRLNLHYAVQSSAIFIGIIFVGLLTISPLAISFYINIQKITEKNKSFLYIPINK